VPVPAVGITTVISIPKAAAVGGTLTMARTYDRANRLLSTTQHQGGTTPADVTSPYFYDPTGHAVQIIDAQNNVIQATYDSLGRKLTLNDPDKGNSSYTWDGLGRLRTQTDANGNYSLYVYNDDGQKLNRYVNASDTSPADSTWSYLPDTGKPGTVAWQMTVQPPVLRVCDDACFGFDDARLPRVRAGFVARQAGK
jgi:YD repeat-containing protein